MKRHKKPFVPDMRSETDAEGAYTGVPTKKPFGKIPAQDADDL
jgi:hypothetical protein